MCKSEAIVPVCCIELGIMSHLNETISEKVSPSSTVEYTSLRWKSMNLTFKLV